MGGDGRVRDVVPEGRHAARDQGQGRPKDFHYNGNEFNVCLDNNDFIIVRSLYYDFVMTKLLQDFQNHRNNVTIKVEFKNNENNDIATISV